MRKGTETKRIIEFYNIWVIGDLGQSGLKLVMNTASLYFLSVPPPSPPPTGRLITLLIPVVFVYTPGSHCPMICVSHAETSRLLLLLIFSQKGYYFVL